MFFFNAINVLGIETSKVTVRHYWGREVVIEKGLTTQSQEWLSNGVKKKIINGLR